MYNIYPAYGCSWPRSFLSYYARPILYGGWLLRPTVGRAKSINVQRATSAISPPDSLPRTTTWGCMRRLRSTSLPDLCLINSTKRAADHNKQARQLLTIPRPLLAFRICSAGETPKCWIRIVVQSRTSYAFLTSQSGGPFRL